VQTLLTLAITVAKSGSHVWGRQQQTRHAAAAWRMADAGSLPVVRVHSSDG
jgi:hypothetical protein